MMEQGSGVREQRPGIQFPWYLPLEPIQRAET